jgi:iron complex outermembrane receptor protein
MNIKKNVNAGRSAQLHALLVGMSAIVAMQPAGAQTVASSSELDEVVVTGTHIAVSRKDAAVPVDVVTTEDLRTRGSPSPVELTKSLSYVTGQVIGDNNFTNQSARAVGSANINLRGLSGGGVERTLVLFNGQRIAPNLANNELNTLPLAATSRIETLKAGGATAYGSDAEAGVVNFITSRTLNGVKVGANYVAVKNSAGNADAYLNFGKPFDRGNLLLSVGYNRTSPLSTLDRSWTRTSIQTNPTQQWLNSSNVGTYLIAASQLGAGNTNGFFTDPGCTALGGVLSPNNGLVAAPVCYVSKIPFQNVVDKVDRFQVYGELNYRLTDSINWHLESWYGGTKADVSTYPVSGLANNFPTLADVGVATGNTQGRAVANSNIPQLASAYYIPASNPGLQSLLGKYSAAQLGLTTAQYNYALTNGINTSSGWAVLGLGGHPAYGGAGAIQYDRNRSNRISTGLDGELSIFGAAKWSANVTLGQFSTFTEFADNIAQNVELALRGLGGAKCTGTTPGANGCQYFNPFSNAWAANGANGVPNVNSVPALANDPELGAWMTDPLTIYQRTRVYTAEAGIAGNLSALSLPGGAVSYALGGQYRRLAYYQHGLGLNSTEARPCTDAGVAAASCPPNVRAVPQLTGPFAFFANVPDLNLRQNASAAYLEFHLPVLKSLSVDLAGRHETSAGISIDNPKLAIRWQIFDFVAIRASAERTFKVPGLQATNLNTVASGSVAVGAVRVSSTVTGSSSLTPETVDTLSSGLIFSADDGNFRAGIDYWKYTLKNQVLQESGTTAVAAMFPTATGHCNESAFAALQARFTFTGGVCNQGNIAVIALSFVNGPKVEVSGLDYDISYSHSLLGGKFTVASNATRNIRFAQADSVQFGVASPSIGNQIGFLNTGVAGVFNAAPLPQWKVESSIAWAKGPHLFRVGQHYVSGVEDNRFTINAGATNPLTAIAGFTGITYPLGQRVSSSMLYDLGYAYNAPSKWQLTVVVANVADKDPPFARFDMNYLQTIGSPLGRTFRVAIDKQL